MMKSSNGLVRKNIGMSLEVAKWYEMRAKELGVSQSNLMVMALSEYIKQDETIKIMSNLEQTIRKLEDAQNKGVCDNEI